MLVSELFKDILEICGVVTLDEAPEASDMQKVRRHVNLLLGSLSARRLIQLSTTTESFPLVGDQTSYTIGSGAEFDTAKPIGIISARVNDQPVNIATQDEFNRWVDGAANRELYYDSGATQAAAPTGTIHLNPAPGADDTLTIDSAKYLTAFSSLTASVTFPEAYHSMLVYNGAISCWRPLGRSGLPPADIRLLADRTMKGIENMNARPVIARTDVPSIGGNHFNIMTGSYGGNGGSVDGGTF